MSRFECPSCERAIINRKIDRCLYCGASLPEKLLFSKRHIEKMEVQERIGEAQKISNRAPQTGSNSGTEFGLGDAIDIASDLGNLLD